MKDITLLIDMDGVVANFEKRVLLTFRKRFPNRPFIPLEERMTFDIEDQYSDNKDKERIKEIYHEKGFFRNLEPMPGAVEAINYLKDRTELFICTSPLKIYDNCVLEKYQWVEEHFDKELVRRVIMTRDKTLVRGNIIIDDRPELSGEMIPSWEQVFYDWPYNRDKTDKRRLTWDNYREVLGI